MNNSVMKDKNNYIYNSGKTTESRFLEFAKAIRHEERVQHIYKIQKLEDIRDVEKNILLLNK